MYIYENNNDNIKSSDNKDKKKVTVIDKNENIFSTSNKSININQ